jgi:hypothetical protein
MWALHLAGPSFELAVRTLEDKENIVDVRPTVVTSIVPVAGALFERLVISLLILFDYPLQADISPDLERDARE